MPAIAQDPQVPKDDIFTPVQRKNTLWLAPARIATGGVAPPHPPLPLSHQDWHKARWTDFRDRLANTLQRRRGAQADLACYLGVSRQTVSRWCQPRRPPMPDWAAVATNIWFHLRKSAWGETNQTS